MSPDIPGHLGPGTLGPNTAYTAGTSWDVVGCPSKRCHIKDSPWQSFLERSCTCTYHVACIPRLVRYLPYDRKCQGYRIVAVGVFYQHEISHTNSNPAQQNLPNIYKAGRVVHMYSKMILSSSLHNCSNLVGVTKLFTKNLQYEVC